jgi:16S rRNA (guanine527-N7)-methyltransferase
MHPSPDLEHRLRTLMTAFLDENTRINLSALRTEDACWHGNILDSLAFVDAVDTGLIPPPKKLIDVGTGGGFPLLPLAIVYPDAACAGLDSIGKKMKAIERIAQASSIPNVTAISERSEILGRNKKHRERYDTVTARAVAPLKILLEYTAPFAVVGGHIVLWKSMTINQELTEAENAASTLGCALVKHFTYDLGGDWGIRQLLIYQKKSATPEMYPRAIGEAKVKPL